MVATRLCSFGKNNMAARSLWRPHLRGQAVAECKLDVETARCAKR